jgi:hypothetical protein
VQEALSPTIVEKGGSVVQQNPITPETPYIDPTNGVTVLVLGDGKPLEFRYDFFAAAKELECLQQDPDFDPEKRVSGFLLLRAQIYGGCCKAARAQGRPWSPDRVDELLPLNKPELLAALLVQVRRSVDIARGLVKGESPAAESGPAAAAVVEKGQPSKRCKK